MEIKECKICRNEHLRDSIECIHESEGAENCTLSLIGLGDRIALEFLGDLGIYHEFGGMKALFNVNFCPNCGRNLKEEVQK